MLLYRKLDEQSVRSKEDDSRFPRSSVKMSSKPPSRESSLNKQICNGSSESQLKSEKVHILVRKDSANKNFLSVPRKPTQPCSSPDPAGTTASLL